MTSNLSNYANSERLLERALQTIPLGTQTFSKSRTQYPHGVSPYYALRGEGGRLWDADGNEYADFVSALGANTLGYNDPAVVEAVKSQLEAGPSFTLPHPIEIDVAERLVEIVPCAEAVRFGKNGSDATSGAIRLARAFTKRDHVAQSGYHGWQDWSIGATARNAGVPQAVRDLTHSFPYNDLASLEAIFAAYPGDVAAVVLEPMGAVEPDAGFLEGVKTLAERHGALLVFDENITGFRFANGGAQEYFDIVPDIACFGKGMSNGYPLSAIVGRADVMKLFEEVFFSFTAGSEAISLAAGLATIERFQTEPITARLAEQGSKVLAGTRKIIEGNDIGHVFSMSGHPSWSFLHIAGDEQTRWSIVTLFLQEMFARGILTLGTHMMCHAHTDTDIEELLTAYGEVLPLVAGAVDKNQVDDLLRCKPLVPLFRVRATA
jgi:glutamate-1-semialdehyde 2,1-aminomutase